MTSTRYKFDPESLQYKEQNDSFKSKFIREYIGVIVAGIIIGITLLMVSAYILVSPSTRKSKRENKFAQQELAEFTKKYSQAEEVLKNIVKRDENIYKAILESDPNEHNQDSLSGFLTILEMFKNSKPSEIADYIDNKLDELLVILSKNENKYKDFAKVFESKKQMLAYVPSIQPVENNNLEIIVYGFGKRIDPFYKAPTDHNGMDYSVPEGTRVFASADGTVSFADRKRGEGNLVVIKHGYGFETKYSHLDKLLVTVGKKISRGEYIGTSGNSGKSMAPHLHYEVHVNNKPVNPVNFFFADFSPEQYDKMIRYSSRGGVSLD